MTFNDSVAAQKIGDILSIFRGDPVSGTDPMAVTSASPGTTGGGAQGPSGADQTPFYQALLTKLGLPISDENLRFMRAWNQAEGMDSSHYNPFATTQGYAGATDINSVGVKSYTDQNSGVDATAQTLSNGLYGNILDALSRSDANGAAAAVAASPWGTGSLVQRVLGDQSG